MCWNRTTTIFVTLAAGSVLGLAGTDLVLPAIPTLSEVFGVGASSAQMVIAVFVAGTATGLILFGAVGRTVRREKIIALALLVYAGLSAISATVTGINTLIALRFFQGVTASAPSVFAIPILRASLSESQAIKAVGLLGSIEATAPALAPIAGAWIVIQWGWSATFLVTAAIRSHAVAADPAAIGDFFAIRFLSDTQEARHACSAGC
jgi:MFS transporter, DHA1 family, multidrug resistance protein